MKKVLLSLFVVCLVWTFLGCEEPVSAPIIKNSEKEITAFVFEGLANPVVADIQGTAVTAIVPYGTDMTELVVSYITSGVLVSVNGVEQESGITANDFTSTVVYTVQAENASSQDYIVMIRQAASSDKSLSSFSFNTQGISAECTINGHSVIAKVPYGIDITKLCPAFQTTGQKVTVGPYTQISGKSEQDFTRPVTYTVHAADGSTANYSVEVEVQYPKSFTSFWFQIDGIEYPGVFDGTSINIELPAGTDVSTLTAYFTTLARSVEITDVVQVSGVTVNDFSTPVTYRVVSMDGSFTDYVISVRILPSSKRELLSFGFTEFIVSEPAYQIENDFILVVPDSVDITNLTPEFVISGQRLEINGMEIVSGSSAIDFSGVVDIKIIAENGAENNFTLDILHEKDLFRTRWDLSIGDMKLELPLSAAGTYNFVIDWGDGSDLEYVRSNIASHLYETAQEYTVVIMGQLEGFGSYEGYEYSASLRAIEQWGSAKLHNDGSQFRGFSNLTTVNSASESIDLSHVTNMSTFFQDCTAISYDISGWDVSNVKNMSGMFANVTSFNQPIGGWNVANVTDMSFMFYGAAAFNQPIGGWNVANVTDMYYMFYDAAAFNQPIGGWNVANVTNMSSMFEYASAFNQNIGGWDTANVTNMAFMFRFAAAFNQAIGSWNTGNVTDIKLMFQGAVAFNQPLNSWNTGKVTDMSYTFQQAVSFNQPLNLWNVSQVTDMDFMFYEARAFNQPLDLWNTGLVTGMDSMFTNATAFNQDLSGWDTRSIWGIPYSFALGAAFQNNTDLHPIWGTNGGL